MKSVTSKLTFGLILAVGAAACGDDVTVASPPVVTPVVRSVIVSPPSANVAQGGSFTFGAAVDADAGLVRTVNWTAAGGTGVTVDATTGVASASATASGVASICATSTADAAIKGCAQLTVLPNNPAANANVDITAITVACTALNIANPAFVGACGLSTPVSPSNVFGQIDVQTTINRPVGSTVTGVRLDVICAAAPCQSGVAVGGVEYSDTQTLSADVIAATEELALQATTPSGPTFSVQTAKYDLSGTGGTAKVYMPNGQKKIRVTLTGGTATAQAEKTLFFRNANGFHITATGSVGGTATAFTAANNNQNGAKILQSSATGFAWVGGTGITVTAVPVSYSGQSVAAALSTTVNFGNGCDGTFGNRALAATVAANGIITGTLPYTAGAAAGAGNVNGYSFNPGFCAIAGGEVPTAAALDATGNTFINIPLGGVFAGNVLNNAADPVMPACAASPCPDGQSATVSAIRLDNNGPNAIGGYVVNPNGRNFGWFNNAVQFNTRNAVNADGIVAGGQPVDLGIGGTVTLQARGGACTSVATCAALPLRQRVGTAASPDPLGAPALPETLTGGSDQAIVQTVDLFGNFTNPGATDPFGVDVTLPTVTATGGVANNSIVPNVAAAASSYAADDATATVGANPSGIVGPNNVNVINVRRDGSSLNFWCPTNAQFQPSAGACAGWLAGTQTFVQGAGVINADPAATNTDGYYGLTIGAIDNAGNLATTLGVRNVIKDATAPIGSGPNFLPSIIPAAGTVTFQGGATDNLDLARAAFAVNYPAVAGGVTAIRMPWVTTTQCAAVGATCSPQGGPAPTGFNFAGPSVLSTTFASTGTVPRSIEQATPAIPVSTNAATAVSAFNYQVWDVARNPSAVIATPIGFGATGLVAGNAAWTTAALAAPFTTATWQMCAQGGAVVAPCTVTSAGNIDVSGNAAGANTNSRLLEAFMTSATNPFQAPFLGGVKFYVVDPTQTIAAGGALVEACTAGSPVNDQITNSWRYSCTYTPSALRVANDLFGFNETTGIAAGVPATAQILAVGFNLAGNGLATPSLAFAHQQ